MILFHGCIFDSFCGPHHSFYFLRDKAFATAQQRKKMCTDHTLFLFFSLFSLLQLDEMVSDMNVEVEASASAIQFAFKSIGLSAANFPQAKNSASAAASMSTSAAPTEEPAVSS